MCVAGAGQGGAATRTAYSPLWDCGEGESQDRAGVGSLKDIRTVGGWGEKGMGVGGVTVEWEGLRG